MTDVASDTLKPPPRRLRNNGPRQMSAIRSSIANFGFLNPILIDEENRIICGHARWLAAKDLGLATVPVIRVDHLTDEQKRVYAIAENRTGDLGEWDEDALRLEFSELLDLTLDLDLSIEVSGFARSEIDDLLVNSEGSGGTDDEENQPAPVTRPGDLWLLGDHRLLCGDALAEGSYTILMGEDRAQMVFSDSPYNLPTRAFSGKGKSQFPDFAMAAGELSPAEFTQFLTRAFDLSARFSQDGAIHFQCMDWRHQREMLDAGEAVYSELKNLVVWDKGKGGMGSFYRSQHELVYVWKVGDAKPINNFGLGDTGRYRTNVWAYRGNNTFHAGRDEELAAHPTVKPMALVADAMRDCSHRGGIVLDCFGGSGTTLLAAEHTGRRARLIEIDPKYCNAMIERWQKMTGREAVLASTGETWTEVAQARGVDLGDRSAGGPEEEVEHESMTCKSDPGRVDDREIVDIAASEREDG
ncbi:site-specific DNA-methyltransferase [Croceicoccus ponticola]|uniref:site-specific DNA-methyltransferase n=1 Tax=Croceicoccus ponticola TaxID=2217664 RepID=UPI00196BB255|nr:DNA methyltransferase [Croceicoccus ponticola]